MWLVDTTAVYMCMNLFFPFYTKLLWKSILCATLVKYKTEKSRLSLAKQTDRYEMHEEYVDLKCYFFIIFFFFGLPSFCCTITFIFLLLEKKGREIIKIYAK